MTLTPRKDRTYLLRNRSLAKVLRISGGWIWADVKPPDGTQHRERFTVADFTQKIKSRTTRAALQAWRLASIHRAITKPRRVTKAASRRIIAHTRRKLSA